jgi:cbb3-type cytochrome oxidase subunit 3
MSLADVMGAMHLPVYAEIGLLVFVSLFIGVLVTVFSRKNRATFDRARFLPLEAESGEAADTRSGWERTTGRHG